MPIGTLIQSMRRPAISALCITLLAVVAAVPAWAQSALERVREEGVVRIGIADEPPYGFFDDQGRLTGEAPTIARAILDRIDPDLRVEGVSMDFGQLIGSLRAREIDMIAAGMFITPQRCERVAFTDPTYVVGEAFAVEEGNPKGLTDYESIARNPDAKVGLISGTVEYNYAAVTGIPAQRALLYPDFRQALDALAAGEVDAVGMTALTVRWLLRERGDGSLESTRQFYPEIDGEVVKGYGGFGFHPDDTEFHRRFNEHLNEFVGSERHWELVEPFGFAPDMAPDRGVEELCAS